MIDPMHEEREKAATHCQKYKAELEKCEARVASKTSTTETCTQELFEFLHCIDHHVSWAEMLC